MKFTVLLVIIHIQGGFYDERCSIKTKSRSIFKVCQRFKKMFDDGEYTTEEEFLESYEYIETAPEGYEIWHLKPHIQKNIKDKYGL